MALKLIPKISVLILYLALLDSTFALSNAPSLTREQCEGVQFDNTSNFGRDSDMGHSSYCWIHAASALLEEHACLQDKSACHKSISRAAVAASDPKGPTLDDPSRRGWTQTAIKNALAKGRTCFEEYTIEPGSRTAFTVLNKTDKAFSLLSSLHSTTDQCEDSDSTDKKAELRLLASEIDEILSYSKSYWGVDHGITPLDLEKLTHIYQGSIAKFPEDIAKQKSAFFQSTVLSNCTSKSSFPLTGKYQVIRHDFWEEKEINEIVVKVRKDGSIERNTTRDKVGFPLPEKNLERLAALMEAKKDHRSAVFEVCASHLTQGLMGSNLLPRMGYNAEMCGGHTVVIRGVRWNEASHQCEFNMQNFWPPSLLGTGWYPADGILNSTLRVIHIQPEVR